MPYSNEIPEYLTEEQVERFYGIHGLAVRRCRGTGPEYAKLGDAKSSPVRYSRASVEKWLAARTFASTTEHSAAITAVRAAG